MKKKLLLNYLAVIACVLMLLLQPAVSQAGLTDSILQQIENTKDKFSGLNQQKENTEQKIKEIRAKSLTVKEQLAEVNRTLDERAGEIAGKEAEIARLEKEIAQKEADIKAVTEQLKSKKGQFDTIVVSNYKSGPVSYLEVVFESRSFSDFLDRLSYVKAILDYETGLIKAIAADQDKLVANSKELHIKQEADKKSLVVLNNLKAQQIAAQQQKQNLLHSLNQQEAQEVAELNAENKAMQELSAQIAELQKQYAASNPVPEAPSAGGWVWPVPSSHTISSGYGWRTILGQRELHNGLDIAAPAGTPIVAAANGVVLYAGTAQGFGHWIVVMHSDHLLSVYGHMYASGLLVKPGEKVTAGQVIAKVGSDGMSTGPHLHFSVITGFDSKGYMITVDPSNYVK